MLKYNFNLILSSLLKMLSTEYNNFFNSIILKLKRNILKAPSIF